MVLLPGLQCVDHSSSEFAELMDNEYDILGENCLWGKHLQNGTVRTNENLFLCKSNENTGKIFKGNLFKSLAVNPVFQNPSKMAKCH